MSGEVAIRFITYFADMPVLALYEAALPQQLSKLGNDAVRSGIDHDQRPSISSHVPFFRGACKFHPILGKL
jgi:hypothetical protein